MKKIKKRLILTITIPLLFTACEIFEPYDRILYHNVGAEGYVYYEDKPVPNVYVSIDSYFGKAWTIDEVFITDTTGYFCVKFPRRTERSDVISYSIWIRNDTLYYDNEKKELSVTPAKLRNSKKNIQLGRLNLRKFGKK